MPRLSACASWSWRKAAVMVPTRTSPGHLTARPSKSFLQRTAGLLTGCIIDCCSHSTHVFLNHAQMDPESVQVDFEWACNLEQPNGGFNFGESCLITTVRLNPEQIQLVGVDEVV